MPHDNGEAQRAQVLEERVDLALVGEPRGDEAPVHAAFEFSADDAVAAAHVHPQV